MTALRVFPFIGALVAVVAVVLAIIGVSTDYWSATDMKTHGGLWRFCLLDVCKSMSGGRASAMAVAALIAMGVGAILAIFSGLARNKSDASNNMARLAGIVSVILLFSGGILIAASLITYIGTKYPLGYSLTLMIFAQFLSFLAAMLVSHWMGHSFTVIS